MFRDWIKQESQSRDLSQKRLAQKMGISQSYLSDVINGKKPPSVEFCHKLADALGETPEHVLRLAGVLPPLPDSDDPILTEAVELLRQLSPHKRLDGLKYLRYLRYLGE